MKERKVFLVTGSGPSVLRSIRLVGELYPEMRTVQVSYGKRSKEVKEENFLGLKEGGGEPVERVREFLGGWEVGAVLNRVDSHISLWGRLVDEFGVCGSSEKAVMWGRDKCRFQEKMEELGLAEEYRPKARVLDFSEFEEDGTGWGYPYVVKPSMGSKSRGVFVIRGREDFERAREYLEEHFEKSRSFRGGEFERKVLVEEFLEDGLMATVNCYVDRNGVLKVLNFVDVYNGRKVGQEHSQLVYRVMPSSLSAKLKQEVEEVLSRFVKGSGLKCSFLFPEFMVISGRLVFQELNVRIGGFRREMVYYVGGSDFDELAVRLAKGEEIERMWKGKVKELLGCVAVEVWEEESGVVERIKVPDDEGVKDVKVYFEKGEKYVAPPGESKPLARFYVVGGEGVLEKAKRLRERVVVEFKV